MLIKEQKSCLPKSAPPFDALMPLKRATRKAFVAVRKQVKKQSAPRRVVRAISDLLPSTGSGQAGQLDHACGVTRAARLPVLACHEQTKRPNPFGLAFLCILKIFECPFDAFGHETGPHLLRAYDALMSL